MGLRTKCGPAGQAVHKQTEEKKEQFRNQNWIPTEESQQRTATNDELFQYFGQKPGEQATLAGLTKLLQKSHTHGCNLNKMAKEQKRKEEEEARKAKMKRHGSFCRKGGFNKAFQQSAAARNSMMQTGEQPKSEIADQNKRGSIVAK